MGAPASGKVVFDFQQVVEPILKQFKKQLIDDKKKMQKQLYADIAVIKGCITKMQKSAKLGLIEVIGKKKKKKAKAKAKAKKDVKSIHELIKKWNKQKVLKKDCVQDKGETKFHYVSRLAGHFKVKLENLKKRIDEMVKKQKGGKALDKGCDAIKHYARQLVEVTCEKIRVDNYACQCEKVIKENKMCNIFDGCYAASVLSYKK